MLNTKLPLNSKTKGLTHYTKEFRAVKLGLKKVN